MTAMKAPGAAGILLFLPSLLMVRHWRRRRTLYALLPPTRTFFASLARECCKRARIQPNLIFIIKIILILSPTLTMRNNNKKMSAHCTIMKVKYFVVLYKLSHYIITRASHTYLRIWTYIFHIFWFYQLSALLKWCYEFLSSSLKNNCKKFLRCFSKKINNLNIIISFDRRGPSTLYKVTKVQL